MANFHGGHRLHVWDRWKASCNHDTGLDDEYVRGTARIALTCSVVVFLRRENVGKATLIKCNNNRDTFPAPYRMAYLPRAASSALDLL